MFYLFGERWIESAGRLPMDVVSHTNNEGNYVYVMMNVEGNLGTTHKNSSALYVNRTRKNAPGNRNIHIFHIPGVPSFRMRKATQGGNRKSTFWQLSTDPCTGCRKFDSLK